MASGRFVNMKNSRFAKSLHENWKGIVIMSCSALAVAIGQLLWKKSAGTYMVPLISGFVIYGVGALLMTISFKFGKLSVVHPWLSTSYVFAIVLSAVVLHEPIGAVKLLGILLVMVGVSMIGVGDHE